MQYLDVSDKSRYAGGNVDQPSLVIKSATAADTGNYSCVLENRVGPGEAQNTASLDVHCKLWDFFLGQCQIREHCAIERGSVGHICLILSLFHHS